VLDNIPLERIARQMNDVKNWESYKNEYVKIFLSGDLERLLAFTSRFVTRGPVVIGARDKILFERMLPFIEREPTLAFIGFPHVPGVTQLLRDVGYAVTQVQV
ncbi:MAG: TraB/GumN family protein, partial [Anaerolineae bacterium]|nr:TraB/GumN family protein [Anaerolineae bacterium]